jgi:Sigma-54 interaction domain
MGGSHRSLDRDLDGVRASSVAVAPRGYAHSSLAIELLARSMRPNVLVIGPVARIEATVAAIVAASSIPVCDWTPDQPLPATGDRSTIVIRDIATLSPALQRAWLAWLHAQQACPAHIIATSSIAVFPLVSQGMFLEDLYYRLNTVLLDVRTERSA